MHWGPFVVCRVLTFTEFSALSFTCFTLQVRCFKCKTFGSLEQDLVKCAHRNCGKYYHKDCSIEWNRIPPKKMPSTASLVCPRHHCDTCRQFQKNAKLYRCLHCPVAYHESCSPEGTNLLEDIPGYLLCWKHDEEWKNEHKVCNFVCASELWMAT